MEQLSKCHGDGQKILFLGFDRNKTSLIDYLISKGHEVWHTEKTISAVTDFQFVISFGYMHMITREVLRDHKCLFINLHISYLPFNRGSNPNFWAFYDQTPSGVTIHKIDAGTDTGDIICQKQVKFDQGETTFVQTYNRLIIETEELFKNWWNLIATHQFTATPQDVKAGTYHRDSDLPKEISTWDVEITSEINRLRELLS